MREEREVTRVEYSMVFVRGVRLALPHNISRILASHRIVENVMRQAIDCH